MARKRKAPARNTQHEFRLEGEGVTLTRLLASDDPGFAVSWASGALLYDEVDGTGKYAREGTPLPPGDYLLSLVGPLQTEPIFRLRKAPKGSEWLVSWEAA